jgi:ketosteroid isomerase-like protein
VTATEAQERVLELMPRFFDALERGDVDAGMALTDGLIHPEIEFDSAIGTEVEGRTFRGRDAVADWFRDLVASFDIEIEDRRFDAIGDSVVLARYRFKGRGKASGIELDEEVGVLGGARGGDAMSNVERAREMMQVWSEGVSAVLARFDEFCSDDFEWHPPITEMTGEAYRGREGFARYVADVKEYLGEVRIKPLGDPEEIAPNVVGMSCQVHGEGLRSGAAVDAPVISLTRWRDGRLCWAWGSYDPAAADRFSEALARGEEVQV